MAYRVDTAPNNAPVLHWDPDPVHEDIDEMLTRDSGEYRSERDEAKEWLEIENLDGPVPVKVLKARAADAGHSWSTVKRAKKEIGVQPKKYDFSKDRWVWYHPGDLLVKREEDHQGNEGDHSSSVGTFDNSWFPSGDIAWLTRN